MENDKGEKRKQESSSDKAAKKAKFFNTNKGVTLPLDTRGILISCIPNKTKPAGQEAIRVLQPYYEELAPASKKGNGDSKDISSLIAEEVADLKDPKKQIFQLYETGIPSLVYVIMAKDVPGPGPSELVEAVAKDVHKSRQCKVRLCMRFTPVEGVCAANLESMKEAAEQIVWPRFKSESSDGLKFAVAYEHRAAAGLDRLTVIKTIADGIKQPPHKADLSNPDLTILVQIVKDACAIGVAARYRELGKYNLRELCNPDNPTSGPPKPATEAKAEKQKQLQPNPERPIDKTELEEKNTAVKTDGANKSEGMDASKGRAEEKQEEAGKQISSERAVDKTELAEKSGAEK